MLLYFLREYEITFHYFFGDKMSSISVSLLAYEPDLIERYQALSSLPGFALLESSDKRRGRYDIVTACPYHRLRYTAESKEIVQTYNEILRLLPEAKNHNDLPFQGGALGYIAYDFAAHLTGFHATRHPLLANMPVVDLGFYDWAIIADHLEKKVFLIAANQQPETAYLVQDILKRWNHAQNIRTFSLSQSFVPLISKDEYKAAFNAIHRDLRRGRAYQVNYTQPFIAQFSGDPWLFYKCVSRKNPTPYAAFLRLAEADVISFSPERFLFCNQGHLLTSPIKGSIQRSLDPAEDQKLQAALIASEKNRAENTMIVDLMRNDLGRIAVPGSVRVESLCSVQSYHSVHHLVSDISAQCRTDCAPINALAACFPGGSITGAPKREAMKIIFEQEAYARGVYCGSIGYFSRHGRFDTNIAIRTITATKENMYLSAGGGIVIDSKCEEEYDECYTKIKAIVESF